MKEETVTQIRELLLNPKYFVQSGSAFGGHSQYRTKHFDLILSTAQFLEADAMDRSLQMLHEHMIHDTWDNSVLTIEVLRAWNLAFPESALDFAKKIGHYLFTNQSRSGPYEGHSVRIGCLISLANQLVGSDEFKTCGRQAKIDSLFALVLCRELILGKFNRIRNDTAVSAMGAITNSFTPYFNQIAKLAHRQQLSKFMLYCLFHLQGKIEMNQIENHIARTIVTRVFLSLDTASQIIQLFGGNSFPTQVRAAIEKGEFPDPEKRGDWSVDWELFSKRYLE